ncbi:hypothetical protein GCM10023091_40690 [Ravibacter arvi]|uniref:Fungal lipase-type domain-containing protein n=2 Tax=Ravibacter arvi TaxID=2051041 RepID=A0ABP8M9A8_9BACT
MLVARPGLGQFLEPGFDKKEYAELLKINQKVHLGQEKWPGDTALPLPERYEFVFRAPALAFDNCWDLWVHRDKRQAVIAVRGTVETQASFMANFYAAMVPAKGSLELEKGVKFDYALSENPHAAVHVGWLVSMAYLSKSIGHKLDSCYKAGIKDFILTGHSQGGGITFLLTSYLNSLKKQQKLPGDMRFKTYCSAAPKPGNLFFAYDYEAATAGGWAFNVVNPADWVPDVPFSLQTVDDFTQTNPFSGAKAMIRKQKFPRNMALRHVYRKLSRPSKKAQKNYERYLGRMVAKGVKKQLPGFTLPEYYHSNYYVRTGTTIVLSPDEEYFRIYPHETGKIWKHHFPQNYLYLLESYQH